ncbi:hypothetical protein BSKO_10775 [Bryopsis sp. KO-2023]|nr:hypothetical protein BSKO_10775 [Bryopsis sp. KO-2023]
MSSATVGYWLVCGGLESYVTNFANVEEDAFVNLRMQDYGKYGVTDMEDRQKLFRLVKRVSTDPQSIGTSLSNGAGAEQGSTLVRVRGNSAGHSGMSGQQVNGGLLDLDNDDGDLLFEAQGGALGGDIMETTAPSNAMVTSSAGATNTPQFAFTHPMPPKIRVVVRKRPINRREKERGEDDIIDINMNQGLLVVFEPKLKVDLQRFTEEHKFVFDDALDEHVTNEDVYRSTVQPLVQTLFCGGKATCFAYGQTGSGKTYTMTPLPSMAASDIFLALDQPEYQDVYLFVSCFEIYGGKVFDLLNARKKLEIREDGKRKVCVVGLKDYQADSLEYIQEISAHAATYRSTGTTGANADSSRSHSVMQFVLKRGQINQDGEVEPKKVLGKISFIDLAGSERGADTNDNNRQTRLEGAEINKSLLALKECIRALESDARHVPFRGSKLTGVLRDSFIGDNARTVMIANVSPNSTSVEHTLNTLRYADRVKQLKKDKGKRCSTLGLIPETNAAEQPGVSDRNAQPAQPPQQQQPAVSRQPSRDIRQAPQYASRKQEATLRRQTSNNDQSRMMDDGPSTSQDDMMAGVVDSGSGYLSGVNQGAAVEPELLSQHEDLMNSILEEEENLIGHHRALIEGNMDLVREEMEMLTEVDQPNSAVDQYACRLEEILKQKAEMVSALAQRLEVFKQMLRQEENLSKTIGQRRRRY